MDDLVIRGAQVIDGSGAPDRAVDVAIGDGRIRALPSGLSGPAQRVIDATGQAVRIAISPHQPAYAGRTSVLVGSDGTSLAPYGATGQGKPHPRFYGTFPRLLGYYVRALGLLSLPQAIYKVTGGSAAALGLLDWGLVRPGYRADLTIFDPEQVADRATFDDPHQYAAGITTVLVNGVVVIDAGEPTGALPGQVLRRQPRGADL